MNTIYIRRAFYQIRYLPHLYKPGLASLIMAGVVYLIHSLLFLPLYLLVYVGTLIAIGGLSFAELQSAKAFLTVGFLKKID